MAQKKLGTMMVCITCVISFYFGNNTSSYIVLHNLQSYCFVFVLHHLASYCIILASPCIALHRLASSCIVLHHLASSCMVLHCLASSCIVLHHLASSCINLALSCIVLHHLTKSRIILHCLAASCNILHHLALSCIILHTETPRTIPYLEDIGLPIPDILQTSRVHISIWMFKEVRYHDAVYNTCSFISSQKIPHN